MAFLNFGGSSSRSSSRSSGTETGTNNVQRLTDPERRNLSDTADFFGNASKQAGPFTREAALEDVDGFVQNLFKRFSEEALPEIFSQQSSSGGFGSTTAQQLSNDAFARTVAEGAAKQFEAVSRFGELQELVRKTNIQGLGTSLQALLQADQTETFNTRVSSKSSGRSKSFGAGLNIG